jgi:hypothetical protein
MSLRNKLILASRAHYDAHIRKHTMNVEVILSNPLALPEHADLMDAIEKELLIVDEYQGKLDVLNKYFKVDAPFPTSDSGSENGNNGNNGNNDDNSDNSDNSTKSTTSTTAQADATVTAGAGSHIVIERPFTV